MDERMIPYFSHEGDMARMERANRRLWIALLVVIILFVASNVFWIWRDSQFEDVVTTTEIEAKQETSDGGDNYVIGGDFSEPTNSDDKEND